MTAATDDLMAERDFLLRSLDDLDAERAAGDIDEADYHALRRDYTARTAAVLRALEQAAGPGLPSVAGPVAVESPGRRKPRLRALAIGMALVAFAGAAGVLVAGSAGDRLPNQPSSGDIERGPTDELAQARALSQKGKVLEAIRRYDAVLAADPRNVEALTYKGWLLRLAGTSVSPPQGVLIDKGLALLAQAESVDPAYPDAHVFRGISLYEDRHDPQAAIPELRAFLAGHPPQAMVPMVEAVLKRALADAGPTSG